LIQKLKVPEGMGVILRAAGASRSKTEIEHDFDDLIHRWEVVRDQTLKSMAPTLVYDASEQIERSPSERIGTNSVRDPSA
jgi:ribonuclease E